MARPRTTSRDETLRRAMHVFWSAGFEATSMADLVEATGSTRQSIYGDFANKHGLYRACCEFYRQEVVQSAIAPMLGEAGGLAGIAAYFETQIALAESVGLPGPGCMIGNAMTEIAPSDEAILRLVKQHNDRLAGAFAQSLPASLPDSKRAELCDFIVLAAQGLWAMSRVTHDAAELRARAKTIIRLVEREIDNGE